MVPGRCGVSPAQLGPLAPGRVGTLFLPEIIRSPKAPDGDFTWTDLFCGGGGSSTGIEAVPGNRVVRASNHAKIAIDTHEHNFPHAVHDMEDLAKADPRDFPATDGLWASPSCTFWSRAAGRKRTFADDPTEPALFDLADFDDEDDEPAAADTAERSRALMHDVPRFAEHHRYKVVIVENTTELLTWWYFPKWIARMRKIGYCHKVLTLNSAFAHQLGAPAPQLRDRVYVVFWQERYREPDWDKWTRPRAYCPMGDHVVSAMQAPKDPAKPYGSYGANGQYLYRCPTVACRYGEVHPFVLPALAVVNTAVPGIRLGDKPPKAKYGGLPLSPKTMARITDGVRRYGHVQGPTWSCPPLLIPMEGREGKQARPALRPHRAQTARAENALLVPAGGTWNDTARLADEPMRTRTTTESEGLCIIPLRNHNRPKHIVEPLDTFAAAGNHHGLAALTAGSGLRWDPNMLYAYDTGMFRALDRDPLPTQTTIAGDALVQTEADVMDCYFRMLLLEEIRDGMAFRPTFETPFGSKRSKVRLYGNAVTPPIARDLIAAVVEAVTGDPIDLYEAVAA
ncbi:DNA cytosine methyltransferase [Pseudonocardiaceae bacterium YIM PH 21723]|nr:DNA cytosine methyltransferase [Pseudonocardiaceae bacterium YIM PH 21723]